MTQNSGRAMTPGELTTHWQTHYGIAPLAHNLRTACADRWLRVYGLPDGKRYPQTDDEYGIVLARHNGLLSELIGEGQEAVLITTGNSFATEPAPIQEPAVTHLDAWHWTTVRVEPNAPDSSFWHLYARSFHWHPGDLDRVLRLVASWQIVNVMVLGIAQRIAYHPYDGGADVIARDEAHRQLLKGKFKNWISPRPDGL